MGHLALHKITWVTNYCKRFPRLSKSEKYERKPLGEKIIHEIKIVH
jgi:hypothetical protein